MAWYDGIPRPHLPDGYGMIYHIAPPASSQRTGYVGQTRTDLVDRLRIHLYPNRSSCSALCAAIRKYGIEKMVVRILHQAPIEQLNALEEAAIIQYHTLAPMGYNLTTGGNAGTEMSEASKAKISQAGTGRKLSQDARERIRRAKIRWHQEHPGASAHLRTQENYRKISEAKRGQVFSDDHRRHISEALTGRKLGAQCVAKMRGRKLSASTRRRMSEAHLRRYAKLRQEREAADMQARQLGIEKAAGAGQSGAGQAMAGAIMGGQA